MNFQQKIHECIIVCNKCNKSNNYNNVNQENSRAGPFMLFRKEFIPKWLFFCHSHLKKIFEKIWNLCQEKKLSHVRFINVFNDWLAKIEFTHKFFMILVDLWIFFFSHKSYGLKFLCRSFRVALWFYGKQWGQH